MLNEQGNEMTERKLASIRKIDSIEPIKGADAIEVATVGGWKVVVKKGDFVAGDLAAYLEIDSWVPTEIAPFLSKGKEPREYNGIKGERLRTVKLRGQVSQGLLLPIELVFPGKDRDFWWSMVDQDVTEQLGIQKWEAPIPAQLAGQVKGTFPSFISKTDQERAQNLTKEIKSSFENGDEYEVTIKLDGSSMTVFLNNDEFGVCSRNLQLKINEENAENSFVKTAVQSGLEDVLRKIGRNLAIQGELMGPGIQGNREGLMSNKFFIFDIFDIDKQEYLTPTERYDVYSDLCVSDIDTKIVNHVPVVHEKIKLWTGDVAELLKYAEGPSLFHKIREGLVYKMSNGQFSFKTISNQFLLKEE